MPIRLRGDKYWVLETNKTAYAMGVASDGRLLHAYYGAKLPHVDDYPPVIEPPNWASFSDASQRMTEEYPAYEGMNYNEPCIKVEFPVGSCDLRLRFGESVITTPPGDAAQFLSIILVDVERMVTVQLNYHVQTHYDIIGRTAAVSSGHPIDVSRIFSGQLHLPAGETYRLHHLGGKWVDEWQHTRETLQSGTKVIDSRRLTSSHHHHPYFAIDNGTADETQGEVWFGMLEWSGNWKLTAEVNEFQQTRISMGINDWDFVYPLQEATYNAPTLYFGYTQQGHGEASRMLHCFIREQVVQHPTQERWILYNSWEATYFDIDIEQQKRFADKAASLGIELFVMDDGWFKGRKDDTAGLGDWTPEASRFPDGLKPLIDHVHGLGMRFGLWVEPEMVNKDSDLYRQHPDWILHAQTKARPATEGRNQLILDLSKQDVVDYLYDLLNTLLTENDIDFIKWDMNRTISEPKNKQIWVDYVEGLYSLWGRLRQQHPDVRWQSCSGGGGRADLGMLRLADQVWMSDNTIPTRRIPMQMNYLRAYPPTTMEAWVTAMGDAHVPLSFRFHVSMCGVLGIGANLDHWDDDDMAEAKKWIAYYKDIRHIVQFGEVYRLKTTHDQCYALQYVTADKFESVVFLFRVHIPHPAPPLTVRLNGLDPDTRYQLQGNGETKSGAAWMHIPRPIALDNFRSEIWHLKRSTNENITES